MSIMWSPSAEQTARTNLTRFRQYVTDRFGVTVDEYAELHRWSVGQNEAFWSAVWDFCGVIASHRGQQVLADAGKMPGARYFPEATLNFAENLLRRRDDAPAIMFRCENGFEQTVTFQELYDQTATLVQALRVLGVKQGDRVAAMMPNIPETVIVMLAVTSLGAVWSSCSPDFGVKGVLDRFVQIEPKLFVTCDGYFYNGKTVDVLDKAAEIAAALPTVAGTIVVPFRRSVTGDIPATGNVPRAQLFADLMKRHSPAEIDFVQVPFNHPLYILFSSGTTGLPKCIVHGAGGTLIKHLSEHQLHTDVQRGDRLFWFTTCGWMMWNWLVSGLASEATLLLFDGSPFTPGPASIFDFAEATRMTHLGTSAKFIQAIGKAGIKPIATHNLDALRVIGSTGSTLLPEGFDYVYSHVKKDVCLSSVSGGTDIIACFIGGDPTGPVYRGELQVKGLGMAVEVWTDSGEKVIGEKGELVCTKPFPSMPIGFWKDDDGQRYYQAYFERFANVWAHGDFAEETANGGFIIYGRSDATLNPGGVRIGTAEIYRQVEQFDEVLESVAIGQEWEGDVRVVLFVVMRDGQELDDTVRDRIRKQIRQGASPRHVPVKIVQVAGIPRTRSGKITELAIRDVVHGRDVKNIEALANPEALANFRNLAELKN